MSASNGGPAFPATGTIHPDSQRMIYPHEAELGGMTLRQYYKAAALKGVLAGWWVKPNPVHPEPKLLATICAQYANALLAEDEEHAKK